MRLRLIGLAGGFSFVIYGLTLGAWPIVITNAMTASINVFHLARLARDRTTVWIPSRDDRLLATPKGRLAARIAAQTGADAGARSPAFRFTIHANANPVKSIQTP